MGRIDAGRSVVAGRTGAAAAALVVLATVLGTRVLDEPAVNLVTPVIAAAVTVVLAHLRRHADVVTLTAWMWLLTPFLRRFVDWSTQYHELSPILLTAPLCSVLALWLLRGEPGARLLRVVAAVFGLAAVSFVYGAAVGMATVSRTAALAAFAELLPPLVLGYVVLTSPQQPMIRSAVVHVARYGLILVGGYAVVQFTVLPAWDVAWIIDSGISTVGSPEPFEVRVFSTLNTAGPLAHAASALLLLLLGGTSWRRPWLDSLAVTLGYLALGLSLVRSAWLCHLVGIAVLLAARRVRPAKALAGALALLAFVVVWGGPVAEVIASRLSESLEEGTQDTSLVARLSTQARLLQEVLADPWGEGLGSAGLATQLATGESASLQNVDSGVFETLLTLGLFPGGLFIVVTFAAAVVVARRARRHGLAAGPAAAFVALTLGLLFTDTYKSVFGAFLWLSLALCGRASGLDGGHAAGRRAERRNAAAAATAPPRRSLD